MATLTEFSLFSGAGGGLLATKHLLGWQTICYVEWDKYAVEVLKARIRDGYLDDAPIWDDAFTFDGRPWAGLVDVVTAGFPCQPFSSAGKGLSENDPRNGWPAVIRILREVRPRYALLENVPGLVSKPYFRRILGELAEAGFDIEQDCISAAEIGANHKRERLWFVAHSNRSTDGEQYSNAEARDDIQGNGIDVPYSESVNGDIPAITGKPEEKIYTSGDGTVQLVANSNVGRQQAIQGGKDGDDVTGKSVIHNSKHQGNRRRKARKNSRQEERDFRHQQWWEIEPDVGRVADGVAFRMDRLRAIGNGQVPAVVREAWNRLGVSK